MRTKILLMIAAAGAAGIVTSTAQVYSVNAVGYVNKAVPANGFAMVSNPLKAATNTINALFAGVPNGFQVYVYTPGKGYDVGTYDDLDQSFGTVGTKELLPGQGVFVKNPTGTEVKLTFVGEVMQGTKLDTPMVAGYQIVSSQVPQAGTATELNFPHTVAGGLSNGDQVYRFGANQQYTVYTFDDLSDDWDKPLSFDVGEAFFAKLAKPVTWTRSFSVNP